MTDPVYIKTFGIMALVGAECGLVGVFIFLLNIPFVGVAIAHSAMAGGIWGIILGFPSKLSALILSLAASFTVGPVSDRSKMNANITLSIIFTAVMGIAFLGVGLMEGKQQLVTGFLWGNIFLMGTGDIIAVAGLLAAIIIIIAVFYRQYMAILFNREIAASTGINDRFFYYLLLVMIGAVITVNLDAIGGLMLFSLIITPPAIAYQLTFGLKKFFVISALAGITGGAGGVAVSFAFNWPVSASVVLFLSALFLVALGFSPKRRRYDSGE